MLMKTASQSLTEQLAQRFAQRIRDRLLAPGARLPSVRECARQHGVSPYTVVAAYDQLLAQGLVEARRQRGFFVRDWVGMRPGSTETGAARRTPAGAAAGAAAEAGSSSAREPQTSLADMAAPCNAAALIRGMFQSASARPQPGMGTLPAQWLQTPFIASAVRRVTSSRSLNEVTLQYGEPLGDSGLRHALASRLAGFDIPAQPSQIITTVGATHALDIVSRCLLKPGDAVMVEEPGWAIEFARLQALGMRVLPVPRGPAGPDLDVMARYCEASPTGAPPRLFVSVSVLHNPTGYCLSPGSAHRVLQLAARHGFHIVEDDTYSHIAPERATRLSALDGLQRTIYVSGFAKILAPNWRVGYLAAPAGLVDRLLDTKLLGTLTTPSLLERALAHCIEQGQLRRHSQRIRTQLDAARQRSVKLAQQAGCRFVAEPAGLFGWVDTGVDTDALSQRALDQGWLIAPGALFHAARAPSTLMRINFATTQDAAWWKAFGKLRREV